MSDLGGRLVSTMIDLAEKRRSDEDLDDGSTVYVEVPDWIPAELDDDDRARLDEAHVGLRIVASASTRLRRASRRR